MEKRIVKLGGKLFVKKIWPKNAQFCSDQNLKIEIFCKSLKLLSWLFKNIWNSYFKNKQSQVIIKRCFLGSIELIHIW